MSDQAGSWETERVALWEHIRALHDVVDGTVDALGRLGVPKAGLRRELKIIQRANRNWLGEHPDPRGGEDNG